MGVLIIILITVTAWWIITTQRNLVTMDENIDNAMRLIGIQLSSNFDTLNVLLKLAKEYAGDEIGNFIEIIQSKHSVILTSSTPNEVLRQENLITEALEYLSVIIVQYPELKVDAQYTKYMDIILNCEKMIHSSKLIYNEGVSRLNQEIRRFPTFLIARIFGFNKREYLFI